VSRRLRARTALALALVAGAAGCRGPEGPAYQQLSDATRLLETYEAPPPDDDPHWLPRPLPDLWSVRQRAQSIDGWYRLEPTVDAADLNTPLAVYLPSFSGRVTVYWNRVRLGDSGAGDIPHVGGPLLLEIPRPLLRPGPNELHVRLQGTLAMPDFLRPPVVGPAAGLRPAYESKRLVLVQLPRALAFAGMAASVLFLLGYWREPESAAALWLSAGLLSWSVSTVGVYDSFGVPERIFEPLRAACYHWAFFAFALAFERLRERSRPRFERGLSLVWGGLTLAIFAVPLLWTYAIAVLWTIPTLLVGAYVTVQMLAMVREAPRSRNALLLVPIAGVGVFAMHDLYGSLNGGRFPANQILLVYTPALHTFAMLAVFVLRSRDALRSSRTLNRDLEARVTSKHRELESNYARLREAEREQAVTSERQRILRDMHDGLGGQLVSTLAMVESGRFEPEEVAEALRDGLDDLRLMVESLDPAEADLLSMLAVLRERVEPRLARRGLRFVWSVSDIPALPHLESDGVLQVLRIVQEALSNIVKHAEARTIRLETGVTRTTPPEVFVRIADDGKGFAEGRRRGRGLGNMRARAEQLGGRLELRSDPGATPGGEPAGTRVTLFLPVEGSTEAD